MITTPEIKDTGINYASVFPKCKADHTAIFPGMKLSRTRENGATETVGIGYICALNNKPCGGLDCPKTKKVFIKGEKK